MKHTHTLLYCNAVVNYVNMFYWCRTSVFQLTWSYYEQLKRVVRTNFLAVFPLLPLLPPPPSPLIFPLLLSSSSSSSHLPPSLFLLLLLLPFFLSFPPHRLIFLLLSTSHAKGSCFVRTDQLDGETDWKLRVAVPACQTLRNDEVNYTKMTKPLGLHPHTSPAYPHPHTHHTHTTHTHTTPHPPHLALTTPPQELFHVSGSVFAEHPHKDIHNFIGRFSMVNGLGAKQQLA